MLYSMDTLSSNVHDWLHCDIKCIGRWFNHTGTVMYKNFKSLLIHAAKGPDYGQYLDNLAAFYTTRTTYRLHHPVVTVTIIGTENSCAANCCPAHRHSANLQLSARLILSPNTNMNRITMVDRTGKQLILQFQPLAGGYSMFTFPVVRKLYRYTIGPAVRSGPTRT